MASHRTPGRVLGTTRGSHTTLLGTTGKNIRSIVQNTLCGFFLLLLTKALFAVGFRRMFHVHLVDQFFSLCFLERICVDTDSLAGIFLHLICMNLTAWMKQSGPFIKTGMTGWITSLAKALNWMESFILEPLQRWDNKNLLDPL